MDIFEKFLRSVFQPSQPHPLDTARENAVAQRADMERLLPDPVTRKVLMITHNPKLHSKGGRTLKEHFGWNDPHILAQGYIDDVRGCSYGYANYEIAEQLVVESYPVKRDGFRYTEDSYLEAWRTRRFHDPDGVDYLALVHEFQMIEKINSGAIDEVWLFGHPYGGYWESIMAGPGAFWCNAPPLAGTEHANRQFVIMGFNFERGVGEMLEDLGHRAESILYKVFEKTRGEDNLFERFTRYHQKHPGRAEVGNVHFAPNSQRDYDWGNPTPVPSRCDSWYQFPDLSVQPRTVTCAEWGNGDIREHHRWWFRHFPHIAGEAKGISWNWWEYVIDPNRVLA
jgi:hypothetical protein